jgi:hypothetical protein
MMMISALGENRPGMRNEDRQVYNRHPEMHEYEHEPQSRRYARHDMPRQTEREERPEMRRRMRYEPPESAYRAHWDEYDEETAERTRSPDMRRYGREMPQSRRRGMYSADDEPMGFRAHRRGEEGSELEGTFRHSSTSGHISEKEEAEPLTETRVEKWVRSMTNEDGTKGAHFGRDQAELLRNAHCPNCDKLEFYAVINMMYSDYCKVAKQMNADRPEFYAHMAKAFLEDKDAEPDKLALYMQYIAGK